MDKLLVLAVGLFSLVSIPILIWMWLAGWLPETTPDYAVVTALILFPVVSIGCLFKPSR